MHAELRLHVDGPALEALPGRRLDAVALEVVERGIELRAGAAERHQQEGGHRDEAASHRRNAPLGEPSSFTAGAQRRRRDVIV
jgi:hypothetical protein